MTTSMLLGIFDWIGNFFKAMFDLIPKMIYLLYASFACVLDVLQLFFRKLAGLDVYYVNGKPVGGDLVTNFISGILGIKLDKNNSLDYSVLSTVFWAFVVFGIIICFASTIIAIIKSHYNYDDKAAKGPMQYVYTAIRSVVSMAVVPIIVVLGLYVSQAVLTALDTITSTTSGDIANMYGSQKSLLQTVSVARNIDPDTGEPVSDKDVTYIYYDIFGFSCKIAYGAPIDNGAWTARQLALIGSTNTTFSGNMFKLAAYNANRARNLNSDPNTAKFAGAKNSPVMNLFAEAETSEELANMIDTAFANNLHLKQPFTVDSLGEPGWAWVSGEYFTNFLLINAQAFSKFNVGLVWYYYDLWQFNFILGFGACTICLTIFINVIIGLITRLFFCIGLFLIAPPLFGLAPLDGGKAQGQWRENFIQQVLMAYGAVVGMNIFFLILPYFNQIDFFNIAIADYFAQTLIIIVGLITIKAFIATISKIIGAADANKAGDDIKGDVGSAMGKGIGMTVGAAKLAAKLTPAARLAGFAGKKIAGSKLGQSVKNKVANVKNKFTKTQGLRDAEAKDEALSQIAAQDEAMQALDGLDTASMSAADIKNLGMSKGLSGDKLKEFEDTAASVRTAVGATGKFDASALRQEMWNRTGGRTATDKSYAYYGGLAGGKLDTAKLQAKTDINRNVMAAERTKSSQLKRVRFAKSVGNYAKDAYSFVQGGFSDAYDLYGKDKFTESFFHESGIRKKANPEKDTATNTKSAAAEAKFQSALAQWQAQHPGQIPTEDDIRRMRGS